MEVKKTKKVDIESQRSTWLLMGLVVALSLLFVSFEWAERDKVIDTSMIIRAAADIEELPPVPLPDKLEPPPVEKSKTLDEILETDNEDETTEPVEINTEDHEGAYEVGRYIPPVNQEEEPDEPEIVDFAEVMPSYKGGDKELFAYLSRNIKYPQMAIDQGVQGSVVIQFVVEADGTINNAVVARGLNPYLDKEALRVISSMPAWNPGMQQKQAVRVRFTVPVKFVLQ